MTALFDEGQIGEYAEKLQELTYPRYAQIKNHVEVFGINFLEYSQVPARFQGIPSVTQRIQTAKERPVLMTRPIQEWMFSLFMENAPAGYTRSQVVTCWRSTMEGWRAFTNKTGWDNGNADYIQGINDGAEAMRLQPTMSHGATLKVLRPPFQMGNKTWRVAFEILDAFDPKTLTLNYKDNRHVISAAINWYRGFINGKRDPLHPHGWADPFPKLGGNDVPIPMLGNHVTESYIELEWVRWMRPDETLPLNPYWGNDNKKDYK